MPTHAHLLTTKTGWSFKHCWLIAFKARSNSRHMLPLQFDFRNHRMIWKLPLLAVHACYVPRPLADLLADLTSLKGICLQ